MRFILIQIALLFILEPAFSQLDQSLRPYQETDSILSPFPDNNLLKSRTNKGQLDSIYYLDWNTTTMDWENKNSSVQHYNENSYLETVFYRVWNSSSNSWKVQQKMIKTYSAQNLISDETLLV